MAAISTACSPLPLLIVAALILDRLVLVKLLSRLDKVQEYIFLLTLAWCMGISQLAHTLGLSYEIGAFLAGIVIAPKMGFVQPGIDGNVLLLDAIAAIVRGDEAFVGVPGSDFDSVGQASRLEPTPTLVVADRGDAAAAELVVADARHEQVLRLHVAVDNSRFMYMLQSLG